MKNFNSKFKSKPSYDLYTKLWYILNIYLMTRIDNYIFFKYYNWNVPNMHLIEVSNLFDINILKEIYEYDYKVFKVLLFLYWDLEYYLDNKDYVKDSLIVDKEELEFIKKSLIEDFDDCIFVKIKFKNKHKFYIEFFRKNALKEPINLWTNLEDKEMFDLILKYDIYSKIYYLDTKFKNDLNIEDYKSYDKFNKLMAYGDIIFLRQVQFKFEKIDPLYYEGYINEWYKEWESEIEIDLTKKYKKKIKMLKKELDILLNSLRNKG